MERQKYNRLILERISKAIEEHPYMRFGQILRNLKVISENYDESGNCTWKDDFYTESEVTWERMTKK